MENSFSKVKTAAQRGQWQHLFEDVFFDLIVDTMHSLSTVASVLFLQHT